MRVEPPTLLLGLQSVCQHRQIPRARCRNRPEHSWRGWATTAAPAIKARAILATLDMYGLGGDGDASPCNSAVPYWLEVILVCMS